MLTFSRTNSFLLGLPAALLSLQLTAQDGVPDLAYGEDGLAHTYVCGICQCTSIAAFDPAGRVVLGGRVKQGSLTADVYATRYTLDGRRDSTYGEYGIAEGYFCTSNDYVYDLAIGTDGSVYVCGIEDFGMFTEGDAAVLKWDPNGQLDTSFGEDHGVHFLDLGDKTYYEGMAIQPDGKIVLSGWYDANSMSTSNPVFAMLHRINTDGSPDTTFGVGSLVVPDPPASSEKFGDVQVQADGRILALLDYTDHVELRRYMPDGSPDVSFATDGIYTIGTTGTVDYPGIFIHADGRITCFVYGGAGIVDSVSHHRVVRLMPDGTPDVSSYGGDGVVEWPYLETIAHYSAMLPDGRLLFPNGPLNYNGVRCLANDGSWDPDFGTGGLALPAAAVLLGVRGIAVGPEQRFVAVMNSESDVLTAEQPDVGVVMYFADSLGNSTSAPARELAPAAGMLIFPSPAHRGEPVTIQLASAALVECVAADGRVALRIPMLPGNTRMQLPTSQLSGGMYMLRAQDADGHQVTRPLVIVD